MALKNRKRSNYNPSQSTLRDLKEGECGGCGTFKNVTDHCCIECDKAYQVDYFQPMGLGEVQVPIGEPPIVSELNKYLEGGGLKKGELSTIIAPARLKP